MTTDHHGEPVDLDDAATTAYVGAIFWALVGLMNLVTALIAREVAGLFGDVLPVACVLTASAAAAAATVEARTVRRLRRRGAR